MSPKGYRMLVRNTKELGLLIRDYRRRRNLTQADLAHQTGVSRKWIIDLEAGKRTTDLSLVLQTLNVLGIELDARDRSKRGTSEIDINEIVEVAKRAARR